MSNKGNLKFVIVGHVDHGKSTLIGRLFFDTNSLPPRQNAGDCTVIVTDHSCYDFPRIVKKSNLVIDTRNATKGIEDQKKIVKL